MLVLVCTASFSDIQRLRRISLRLRSTWHANVPYFCSRFSGILKTLASSVDMMLTLFLIKDPAKFFKIENWITVNDGGAIPQPVNSCSILNICRLEASVSLSGYIASCQLSQTSTTTLPFTHTSLLCHQPLSLSSPSTHHGLRLANKCISS